MLTRPSLLKSMAKGSSAIQQSYTTRVIEPNELNSALCFLNKKNLDPSKDNQPGAVTQNSLSLSTKHLSSNHCQALMLSTIEYATPGQLKKIIETKSASADIKQLCLAIILSAVEEAGRGYSRVMKKNSHHPQHPIGVPVTVSDFKYTLPDIDFLSRISSEEITAWPQSLKKKLFCYYLRVAGDSIEALSVLPSLEKGNSLSDEWCLIYKSVHQRRMQGNSDSGGGEAQKSPGLQTRLFSSEMTPILSPDVLEEMFSDDGEFAGIYSSKLDSKLALLVYCHTGIQTPSMMKLISANFTVHLEKCLMDYKAGLNSEEAIDLIINAVLDITKNDNIIKLQNTPLMGVFKESHPLFESVLFTHSHLRPVSVVKLLDGYYNAIAPAGGGLLGHLALLTNAIALKQTYLSCADAPLRDKLNNHIQSQPGWRTDFIEQKVNLNCTLHESVNNPEDGVFSAINRLIALKNNDSLNSLLRSILFDRSYIGSKNLSQSVCHNLNIDDDRHALLVAARHDTEKQKLIQDQDWAVLTGMGVLTAIGLAAGEWDNAIRAEQGWKVQP